MMRHAIDADHREGGPVPPPTRRLDPVLPHIREITHMYVREDVAVIPSGLGRERRGLSQAARLEGLLAVGKPRGKTVRLATVELAT
jgi:hypothetical protein